MILDCVFFSLPSLRSIKTGFGAWVNFDSICLQRTHIQCLYFAVVAVDAAAKSPASINSQRQQSTHIWTIRRDTAIVCLNQYKHNPLAYKNHINTRTHVHANEQTTNAQYARACRTHTSAVRTLDPIVHIGYMCLILFHIRAFLFSLCRQHEQQRNTLAHTTDKHTHSAACSRALSHTLSLPSPAV